MSPGREVAWISLWMGLVSFGGGLAVLPEMHRELVVNHAWITPREFADGYALAQLSPGPNMLCMVFYAYRAAGLGAALLATVAVVAPGATLSAVCGRAWSRLATHAWTLRLRRGLLPVGLGLMAGGVYVVGRATLTHASLGVLAALVAVAVTRRWVNPAVAVVLAGVAVGALG